VTRFALLLQVIVKRGKTGFLSPMFQNLKSKHSLFSAGIDVFLWNQYVQQFWIQYSINKLVVALKKFQLSDRSTLQERVTTALRQAILSGFYQPGERLKQEKLADELSVSRMPVREALRQLEDEGLITWERHKGAVVKEITAEDLAEIYALRAELEPLALRRSFHRITEADLEHMQQLIYDMDEAIREDEMELYCRLNFDFHRLLLSRSPWQRLQSIIKQIWNGIPLKAPTFVPGQAPRSHQDHREMVKYIREAELEKCCQVLRKHITVSGEQLVAYLQQKEASLTGLSKDGRAEVRQLMEYGV